jgi:hypothetical protein
MLESVVKAPVVELLLTEVKPPSERTGPEKVVLAMLFLLVVANVYIIVVKVF